MNATKHITLCHNQVALDHGGDRYVTCDDGRRLDLELYRDYSYEQAAVLRRRAVEERRAHFHAALREAAASCVNWVRAHAPNRAAAH